MKKIHYVNPNAGSNWIVTKLYNVPGILKYYKTKPAGILYEEPFIVDSYGYLIKTIDIFQLSPSHINLLQLEVSGRDFKYRIIYTLTNQPDIIEYQNEVGLERLRRYLRKLGWRGIESEYYDDDDERSMVGSRLGPVAPVVQEASVLGIPDGFADPLESVLEGSGSRGSISGSEVSFHSTDASIYYTPNEYEENSVFRVLR